MRRHITHVRLREIGNKSLANFFRSSLSACGVPVACTVPFWYAERCRTVSCSADARSAEK